MKLPKFTPGVLLDSLLVSGTAMIFTGLAFFDVRIALVTTGILFLAGARAGVQRLPPPSERGNQHDQ